MEVFSKAELEQLLDYVDRERNLSAREIFASWEELLSKEYYDESILDLIWAEIKDSMLEVLDI